MDFPGFARHQIALKCNCMRGVYERQTLYRRIQERSCQQVTERGYSVSDVAKRLGTTTHSLYGWLKKYGEPNPRQADKADLSAENARLKADLKRMTEERDILKKAAKYFANDPG